MKIATLLVCGCKVYVTWYVYICEYIIVLEKIRRRRLFQFFFLSLSWSIIIIIIIVIQNTMAIYSLYIHPTYYFWIVLKTLSWLLKKNDRRRRRRTALMWCVLILKKEFHFVLFLLSFKGVKSKSCRNSTLSHHPKNFYF